MIELLFSSASEEDMDQIATYILDNDLNAAIKWLADVRQRCEILTTYPQIGDAREDLGAGVRSIYFGRYIIFFRSRMSAVEVIRVIPGDRDVVTLWKPSP